jgi:hypothetical protein
MTKAFFSLAKSTLYVLNSLQHYADVNHCTQNHNHQSFVLHCKMVGRRFEKTPLPAQGRCLGIVGRIVGQQGGDNGPLTVNLDQITFIPAVNPQPSAGSPSKPSKGPGYFKKRKREAEENQIVGDDVIQQ